MNEERITKLLAAHADLEAAARECVSCMEDESGYPVSYERYAEAVRNARSCLSALDALRADIEAHPAEAKVCATCTLWERCVIRPAGVTSTPTELHIGYCSHFRTALPEDFYCKLWNLDPTAGVKPRLVIDYSKPEEAIYATSDHATVAYRPRLVGEDGEDV